MINLTPGLKGTSEANVSKPSCLPLPQEGGLEGGVSSSWKKHKRFKRGRQQTEDLPAIYLYSSRQYYIYTQHHSPFLMCLRTQHMLWAFIYLYLHECTQTYLLRKWEVSIPSLVNLKQQLLLQTWQVDKKKKLVQERTASEKHKNTLLFLTGMVMKGTVWVAILVQQSLF